MTTLAPMTISDPLDLCTVMRIRRQELGLSAEDVDHISGLTRGHTNKLENADRQHGRGLGSVSFSSIFPTLGLQLVVVPTEPHPKLRQFLDPKAA